MDDPNTGARRNGSPARRHDLSAEFARVPRIILLLGAGTLLIAAFLSANCSGSDNGRQSGSAGGKRTSDAGSVTLELSWEGPESGLVFEVAMDTHSIDLDGFDLKKLAVLRTDSGVEVAPIDWAAPNGGHHREGKLSFPATSDGRRLLDETTRGVTIIVRDVAAPERSFRWTW
jgi:hypothetical protein